MASPTRSASLLSPSSTGMALKHVPCAHNHPVGHAASQQHVRVLVSPKIMCHTRIPNCVGPHTDNELYFLRCTLQGAYSAAEQERDEILLCYQHGSFVTQPFFVGYISVQILGAETRRAIAAGTPSTPMSALHFEEGSCCCHGKRHPSIIRGALQARVGGKRT